MACLFAPVCGHRFNITVIKMAVYDSITGPTRRLDMELALRKPEPALLVQPHGIIGQVRDLSKSSHIFPYLHISPSSMTMSMTLVDSFSSPRHHRPQGWDGTGKPRKGKTDTYPREGSITTSAMAEGAIEGVPTDYEVCPLELTGSLDHRQLTYTMLHTSTYTPLPRYQVATPYETAFKFSKFDAAPRKSALEVAKSAYSTVVRAFAGAGERKVAL